MPPSGAAVDEAELTRLEAVDAFEELVELNQGKQNVNRRQVSQFCVSWVFFFLCGEISMIGWEGFCVV